MNKSPQDSSLKRDNDFTDATSSKLIEEKSVNKKKHVLKDI